MTVETYRYLFSALIQVFGAIIAVGGIFVVWKYDIVQHKLEQLTKRLGILVNFIETGTDRTNEAREYSQTRADEFLTYEPYKVIERVEKMIKLLDDKISIFKDNNKAMSNIIKEKSYTKRRIEFYLKKFQHYLKIKDSFQKAIWRIMGIPALLVIILSIGLVCTDCIPTSSSRILISLSTIILSLIGLCSIISISSKSFKEELIWKDVTTDRVVN